MNLPGNGFPIGKKFAKSQTQQIPGPTFPPAAGLLKGEVDVRHQRRHVAEGVAEGVRQTRLRGDAHLAISINLMGIASGKLTVCY